MEETKEDYKMSGENVRYPHNYKSIIIISDFSEKIKKLYTYIIFSNNNYIDGTFYFLEDNMIKEKRIYFECVVIPTELKINEQLFLSLVSKDIHFEKFFEVIYNYCIKNNILGIQKLMLQYNAKDENYNIILYGIKSNEFSIISKNGIPQLITINEAKCLKMKEVLNDH